MRWLTADNKAIGQHRVSNNAMRTRLLLPWAGCRNDDT